jgi:hypothetical protein
MLFTPQRHVHLRRDIETACAAVPLATIQNVCQCCTSLSTMHCCLWWTFWTSVTLNVKISQFCLYLYVNYEHSNCVFFGTPCIYTVWTLNALEFFPQSIFRIFLRINWQCFPRYHQSVQLTITVGSCVFGVQIERFKILFTLTTYKPNVFTFNPLH